MSCSGQGSPNIGTTISYWENHDCITEFSTELNTLPDGSLGFNSSALPLVQSKVQSLFDQFNELYTITSNTTSTSYSTFQERLLSLCNDTRLPGVCDSYLTSFCSTYTRDQVSADVSIADFCGCYAPVDPKYSSILTNVACDPLCHRARTIQKSTSTCDNTVCVIDAVSIGLSNSTVGNVGFSQVCGGCAQGSDPCKCIISSANVNGTLSDLGVGAQYNQVCGTNSICMDADGNTQECSSSPSPPIPSYSSIPPWWFIVILIIVTIIAVLTLFLGEKHVVTRKVLNG